ncbi:MAG: HDIG domain-containing protein [Lentisphaerae bacterium]|nr:HDIG domain-containing protein [Lentisphaerota bacterium]
MNFITRALERRRMEREGQLGTRKRRTESVWGEAADRSPVLTLALVLILLGVCVTVLTLPELRSYPKLVAGQLAPVTLFSRVGFVYLDKAATEAKEQKIRAQQPRYFKLSAAREAQVKQRLRELFAATNTRWLLEQEKKVYTAPDKPLEQEIAALSPSAFLGLSYLVRDPLLREQFESEVQDLLDGGIIDPDKLNNPSKDMLVRIVDSANRDRPERKLESVINCNSAAEYLQKQILSYSPEKKFSKLDAAALKRLMLALLDKTGNLELDGKRTMAEQEKAVQKVGKVMVEVNKNDVLVKRNALVTEEILGKLTAHESEWRRQKLDEGKYQRIMNNLLWSLTLILFAGFYMAHIHPEITRSSRSIAMIVTVSAVSLGINYLAMENFYFFSAHLAIPPALVADALPLALPAVLLTVMAGYRVALYVGFFTAMVSALMVEDSFSLALEGFVLSALCGLVVRSSNNYRTFFLRSFFCVFIAAWLLDFDMIWHLRYAPFVLVFTSAMAFVNALFTAVSAMLLTFLFELLFNVSTNMSLMVLCDYNHPLLKELHLNAPGTSLHSQNVATLAENAAVDIEANAVLARAGALFHDIGKIKKPEYFIENNQSGVNPHDKLTPRMSSMIISNHVKDGLDLALQYKLCRVVRQFIQQHHGTDLIQYFYHQALNSKEPVLESDYRYPGPLPHAKEVVIVSLADACEAACRSLEKPSASKIEAMVNDIFRKRWREGQLDNAALTIEELSTIRESFSRTLTTMYHGRIAYPKDENSDENDVLIQERPTPGAE